MSYDEERNSYHEIDTLNLERLKCNPELYSHYDSLIKTGALNITEEGINVQLDEDSCNEIDELYEQDSNYDLDQDDSGKKR